MSVLTKQTSYVNSPFARWQGLHSGQTKPKTCALSSSEVRTCKHFQQKTQNSLTKFIMSFFARLSTYLHAREYHVVEAGDQGEEGVEHPAGQAQLVKACRECGKYCDQNTAQPTPIYNRMEGISYGNYRLRLGSILSN